MLTAGIDIGSTLTKTVLLDGQKTIFSNIRQTLPNHRGMVLSLFEQLQRERGISQRDIAFTVGTGYGRANVPFADRQVTEITCHAKGVSHLFPEARTIIEIGGQDSKAIKIDCKGHVDDFVMNDKCAAGTGRFLQMVADTMMLSLEEMNQLALESQDPANIQNYCAVLAQQELIAELSKGTATENVLAGLYESFAKRILKLAAPVKVEPELVMTGGGALHEALRRAIENQTGFSVRRPTEPLLTGAIGAALWAQEWIKKHG